MFYRFNQALDDQGIFANTGQIVDASFVEVPRQRNIREENKEIKAGKTPEAWKENPHKLRQKDVDARWAKKITCFFMDIKTILKPTVEQNSSRPMP